MLNRKVFTSIVLLILAAQVQATTPWREIAKRVSDYAAHPSPKTAVAAINVIPVKQVVYTNSDEENKANDIIYAPGPMGVLQKRVLMKERESVELAFRMRYLADGAFMEDLDIMLGKLIKIDPELFLKELQHENVPMQAMGGLVGNLGNEYVDKMEKQCKEMQYRKNALLRVSNHILLKTRNRALSALDEDMAFCNNAK